MYLHGIIEYFLKKRELAAIGCKERDGEGKQRVIDAFKNYEYSVIEWNISRLHLRELIEIIALKSDKWDASACWKR